MVGKMYYEGNGVLKNNKKVVTYFKKAANQGDKEGQYHLGMIYCMEPDQQNISEGIKYLTLSAKQGYTDSLLTLGFMYEGVIYVDKDFSKAKKWYGKACDNGEQLGCEHYKRLNKKSVN